MNARRIFLVEDHPIACEGYRMLLSCEADLEVCGEAGSAEEAFALIPDLHPDVVVVDLSLPGVNGLELIKRFAAFDACEAFLVISAHDETLYAERALAAGARGYLMKSTAAEEFVDAIRQVAEGRLYLSDQLRDRLVSQRVGSKPVPTTTPMEQLTDRELEVFEHFGRGRSTSEVAEGLGLSTKTVESHRANIMKKLGIAHAPEFMQQAVLWTERSLSTGQMSFQGAS